MVNRFPIFALAVLLGHAALGCSPQIGKGCTLSTDCSPMGDRLCDSSQPGGYCTIFNCNADTCPSSICVAFNLQLDPACGVTIEPRYQRNYCLAPCGGDGDCRGDYQCVDLSSPYQQSLRAAQVVDTTAADGGLGYKVCMVAAAPDAGLPTFTPSDVPAMCKASNRVSTVPTNWPVYQPGGGGAGGASPSGDAGPADGGPADAAGD